MYIHVGSGEMLTLSTCEDHRMPVLCQAEHCPCWTNMKVRCAKNVYRDMHAALKSLLWNFDTAAVQAISVAILCSIHILLERMLRHWKHQVLPEVASPSSKP